MFVGRLLKTGKSPHDQPLAENPAPALWCVEEDAAQGLVAPTCPPKPNGRRRKLRSSEGGLDPGAARAPGGAHPPLAAVAAFDRAQNRAGQSALRHERDPARRYLR